MTSFDDLALLRAFVGIVESGSISAAARRLKLPQPSLSRHLRTLEDRCGASLLQRDTHQMSLTETGRRLLADARTLLDLAENAQQRLRADQTSLSGHLRVFATIDGGQFIVTRLLTSFLQKNPQVTAELAFTNRPVHLIQEGCDVGVVVGPLMDESVVARAAGTNRRHLVAAPVLVNSRPGVKRPADLQGWPWIAVSGIQFREANKITLYGPKRAEQTLWIDPILLTEGITSIREAARAGLGVAILPDWLIAEDLRGARLLRLLPDWRAADVPMHVVYAAQRLLPLRVRAFVDFAIDSLTQTLRPEH